MGKDTSKIVEELGLCPGFKTFYDENKDYMMQNNLSDLERHGLKKDGHHPCRRNK